MKKASAVLSLIFLWIVFSAVMISANKVGTYLRDELVRYEQKKKAKEEAFYGKEVLWIQGDTIKFKDGSVIEAVGKGHLELKAAE